MKKKRIKWKTTRIICFFTLTMSFVTFVSVIGFFLLDIGPRIEMKQQAVFDTVDREIFDIVNDDELSFQRLDSYRIDGYTIIIFDAQQNTIYPIQQPITAKNGELIHLTNGYQSTFDTNGYKVYVSYPVQISAVDVKEIIWLATPFVLLLVSLLTLAGSGLYTYLYRNEKSKLASVFHMMEKNIPYEEIHDVNTMIKLHDYLVIETQVTALYQQLQCAQRAALEQVQQIKQLELEKKTLLEGFTHEMKTPIMASQLLLANVRDDSLSEEQQESLLATENELKKLQQLIKEILFVFHNQQAHDDQPLSVREMIDHLIEEYEVLWSDKGLRIEIDQQQELTFFYHPKLAKKIFSNLLSNAIFHSPPNSVVTIILTNKQLTIKNPIKKTGPLKHSDLAKPFFSYGEEAGTGLGLYIVKTMLKHSHYGFTFDCQKDFTVSIYKKQD